MGACPHLDRRACVLLNVTLIHRRDAVERHAVGAAAHESEILRMRPAERDRRTRRHAGLEFRALQVAAEPELLG